MHSSLLVLSFILYTLKTILILIIIIIQFFYFFRYSNVKYETEEYPRFPYQPQNRIQATSDEIKTLEDTQPQPQAQDIQIYEQSEAHNQEQQGHPDAGEAKAQYTNLETVQQLPTGSSYYITSEGYGTPTGNYSYLQSSSSKEYPSYHPSSPSTVLYKGW